MTQQFEITEAYVKAVRERLAAALVVSVPDDKWNEMIKKEIEEFFSMKEHTHYGSWGNSSLSYSTFKQCVNRVLQEETQKRMIKMFASPEWAGYWDDNKLVAGQKVSELVRQYGAEILSSWLENSIGQVLRNIQQQIR